MTTDATTDGKPTALRKELGLFDVYAISTGAMFSSGFFLLPGLAAAQTGPSVSLAYLVAGLFILPAMFSVAELATAMPKAGGAYYFLDRALGPLVGTVGGLGTWVALVLKTAFALVGMGAYLAIYFDVPIQPLAVGLTVLFMAINIVGAKETSGLQRVLVSALVVILGFFILQGMFAVGDMGFVETTTTRFSPFFAFGFTGFMATVGFVFVSYAGLTKVASVAEEVEKPDRNIPLGMILSLLTAAVIYSVGVYILVAVLPPDELRSDLTPVATAAEAFFDWLPGGAGVVLITVAAIAAFASTGNAGILSASRYPMAMARDNLFPARFANLGRFQTPTLAILFTGGLIIGSIVLLDVAGIAKLASAFQLLLFALLNVAVMVMRESQIDAYDPGFRSPLYPWMQIFGILAPFWLISEMGEMAVLFTLILIAFTVAWYFKYAASRVERTGAIFHTFARLGERRHGGLDMELRAIVREKGLRDEDPFDEVVARSVMRLVDQPITLEDIVKRAAEGLQGRGDVPAEVIVDELVDEMRSGDLPIAHQAVIAHMRVPGIDRTTLFALRCLKGIREVGDEPEQLRPHLASLRAVFVLVSPESEPGQHLRILGHLASHVDDPGFLEGWMAATNRHQLRDTLLREERSITLHVEQDLPTSTWIDKKIAELTLPDEVLIAVIRRAGHGIIAHGNDVLREGDHLIVIGDPEGIEELARQFGRPGD